MPTTGSSGERSIGTAAVVAGRFPARVTYFVAFAAGMPGTNDAMRERH